MLIISILYSPAIASRALVARILVTPKQQRHSLKYRRTILYDLSRDGRFSRFETAALIWPSYYFFESCLWQLYFCFRCRLKGKVWWSLEFAKLYYASSHGSNLMTGREKISNKLFFGSFIWLYCAAMAGPETHSQASRLRVQIWAASRVVRSSWILRGSVLVFRVNRVHYPCFKAHSRLRVAMFLFIRQYRHWLDGMDR